MENNISFMIGAIVLTIMGIYFNYKFSHIDNVK